MKTTTSKINNVIGQLEGIKKMINSQRDCLEIINQLKAVRSAISAIMNNYSQEELARCLSLANKKDKLSLEKIFKEIIKNNH